MVRKLYTILFLCFVNSYLYGSHNAGLIELTYRNISGTTYEFTGLYYNGCGFTGPYAPASITVYAESASLGISRTSAVTLTKLPTTGPGVPPLITPNFFECSSIQMICEEHVYRGSVNLSTLTTLPYADDWIFSIQVGNYPTGVWTPDNISSVAKYVSCGLNNLDFSRNDSPFWHDRRPNRPGHLGKVVTNFPGKAVCAGRRILHKQNVVEYEGDRVSYELVPVKDAGGIPVTYKSGYTYQSPMVYKTPPGFHLDTLTGHMDIIADSFPGEEIFIIGIRANEFRMDTVMVGGVPTPIEKRIGYVDRNYMILVDWIGNCSDNNFGPKDSIIKLECLYDSLDIEMNIDFMCESADFDGSFLKLFDSSGTQFFIPDSVVVRNCGPLETSDRFTIYLPNALQVGSYNLVFQKGTDSNTLIGKCGLELKEFLDTIAINVGTTPRANILTSIDSLGNPLPFIKTICGQESFVIRFDERILCSSIDPDGSDFLLVDSNISVPAPLLPKSATPLSCNNGYTDKVELELRKPLEAGKYAVYLKNGNDGNTLMNQCNQPSVMQSVKVISPELEVNLGPDTVYCSNTSFLMHLDPGSGYFKYEWNTGEITRSIYVMGEGIFSVKVENEFGCVALDSIVVTEVDCWTGSEELAKKQSSVYPVPAFDVLNVKSSGSMNIESIVIRDIRGQKIPVSIVSYSITKGVKIDISLLTNGVYFVSFQDSMNKENYHKFVVAH